MLGNVNGSRQDNNLARSGAVYTLGGAGESSYTDEGVWLQRQESTKSMK